LGRQNQVKQLHRGYRSWLTSRLTGGERSR
jgi:hypothetical protein